LSVTFHVPLIGSLRINDSLPGPLAQALCGRKIRMACAGDIPDRPLSDGNVSNKEQAAKDNSKNSGFDHGADSTCNTAFSAIGNTSGGE
jgi:hypothetical protein